MATILKDYVLTDPDGIMYVIFSLMGLLAFALPTIYILYTHCRMYKSQVEMMEEYYRDVVNENMELRNEIADINNEKD